MTVTPQPLAVETITSTSSSNGRIASTFLRMAARAAPVCPRCRFKPPQQPSSCAATASMPLARKSLSAAACAAGVATRCTQPRKIRARRTASDCGARDRTGTPPASFPRGSILPSGPGSNHLNQRPRPIQRAKVCGCGTTRPSQCRAAASQGNRLPRSSTTSRPISSSSPYWTPEGQATSQPRQVRQRSRWVRTVCTPALSASPPSSSPLMRYMRPRGPSSSSPSNW